MSQRTNKRDTTAPFSSSKDENGNPTPTRERNLLANTKENASRSNAIEIPTISLPQGGGALRGIDEKFKVNAANGTATCGIPLPTTAGRNGFSPAFALGYNSGAGNSAWGLGWSLDYSSIQRKTDKKLPAYREMEGEEDVFMFSGTEDLVLDRHQTNEPMPGYFVKKYRPRVEGGFLRIEKIFHKTIGTYWRVTTRDNMTTIFGRRREARIADPVDGTRIFQWLPELSYDDKGNWIEYHYKTDSNYNETGTLVKDETIPDKLFERNRKRGLSPYTNTYLKGVTYGNRTPYYVKAIDAF